VSDFDPTKHLRQLRGKGGTADYLDVKWRLVWLRAEHPDATTAVEHVEISPDIAICRATVTIPGAGSATDYGSETPKDFGDYIEKAATKALGRALAQLGYGTQFVGFELDENTRIVDSPVDRKRQPEDDDGHTASQPRPQPAPARNAAPAFATPRAAPLPADAPAYDEHLTWTDLWSWARPRGFRSKAEVATALGQPDSVVNDWSPAQIRTALEVHIDRVNRRIAGGAPIAG
jgi:hypothetical protein